MSWRDALVDASFRGVAFHASRHSHSGGRRVSVDEFPRGEAPLTEDLGALTESFRIDAYLFGLNYLDQASRLKEALDQKGSGRLVIPWLGEVSVHCVRWRREESELEGGFVRFSLTFVEKGDGPTGVSVGSDAVAIVDAAAEAASSAATTAVSENLVVENSPEFVRDPISAASAAVSEALAPLEVFSDLEQEVAAQASALQDLASLSAGLLTSPADLASTLFVAFDRIGGSFSNALGSFSAYKAAFGIAIAKSGGRSELSAVADANGETVTSAARALAVTGAARSAVRVDWDSRSDAIEARDEILAEIDELLAISDDASYLALANLRSAIVDQIPNPAIDIPQVDLIRLGNSLPALVVAFRETGDPAGAESLIARNKVRHPGFVPAGVDLEVIRDD